MRSTRPTDARSSAVLVSLLDRLLLGHLVRFATAR